MVNSIYLKKSGSVCVRNRVISACVCQRPSFDSLEKNLITLAAVACTDVVTMLKVIEIKFG